MKYWLFQNNQVVGPYDRDELAATPGFASESLVCPEGRKGTQMGDWQRAGVLVELAETLLKMARVPAGVGVGGASFLPPEPTLRDLAVLGTIQEKVSLLENSLSSLHEELRAREEEISGLKVELSQKGSEAASLQIKVGDLEQKLAKTDGLRDEIDQAKKAQDAGDKTVSDLRAQLDSVRADLQSSVGKMEENQERLREDLTGKISKLRVEGGGAARPAPAAAWTPPVQEAHPAPAPLPKPVEITHGFEPPAMDAPSGFPPDSGFGAPIELGGATPAPVPLDSPPAFDLNASMDSPPGMPPILDAPTPMGGGLEAPGFGTYPTPLPTPTSVPGPEPLFGPETTGGGRKVTEAPVDLMAPEPKPKKGKKVLAVVALLLVAGGLGGAYQMGILNPYLKQFGLVKGTPAAPVETPAEPQPEAPLDTALGLPDRTQEAVEFARAYPITRLNKSLGQVLEATASGNGLVSPWNVKPGGDGRWEVSFYGKPGRLDYGYEVRLDAKEVRGLNAKSQAVLDGKAPAPAKPERTAAAPAPKRRKGRYSPAPGDQAAAKAASKALSDDPLGSLLMESSMPPEERPAPKPKRVRRAAAPVETPAEDQPQEDLSSLLSEPPAEEAPRSRRRSAAAKSKEELTLDELLLPGVPKQR
ncbi:MAG: hypothetical protein HYZ75_15075 [Elusimicrobia bacterium]|nr:hypothetical protein [Elusimicrobiota bacterium]